MLPSIPRLALRPDPSPIGPLQVYLLGAPAQDWSGAAFALPRRQARALLYRLASELRPVPRAELAYLFWPDTPDVAARRHLTHLLTHLRQGLPDPGILLATPEQVALDANRTWTDSAHLARMLADAAPPPRPEALESALDLIRGPFLHGFDLPAAPEFEGWAAQERSRWDQRVLALLALLIDQATTRGDYPLAIRAAQRVLDLDPLAEESHRHLMRLYAAVGDRAAVVRQFERCVSLLDQELGVPPLPETVATYEQALLGRPILAEDSSREPRAPEPARIPLAVGDARLSPTTTRLIGRDALIEDLAARILDPAVRLLTVSGPGGIGKTRLAQAVLLKVRPRFAHGGIAVALAPVASPAEVINAIAQALGSLDHEDRDLLERLARVLAPKHMLLLLDNFEHVLESAPLLSQLLAAAPSLTIMVTSRVVLRLSGEQVFLVPPLDLAPPAVPLTPAQAAAIPAVALLLERVQAHSPGFQITPENVMALSAICRRLDGLPLAIELAAARMNFLSPAMLLARLDRRLSLLVQGPRDLPVRQQTLRATIDWSYRLLSAGEQALVSRLAVFTGGWTLEAAEAVVAGAGAVGIDLLDGLQALLESHFVLLTSPPGSEPRFTMLESIREYALEQLTHSGALAATQSAHARYFCAMVEQPQTITEGARLHKSLQRLDEDIHNIRAALAYCESAGDWEAFATIIWKLDRYWSMRGLTREIHGLLQKALRQRDQLSLPLQAEMHKLLGANLAWQGDFGGAQAAMHTSLDLFVALDDPMNQMRVFSILGNLQLKQGRFLAARAYVEDGLKKAFAVGASYVDLIGLLGAMGMIDVNLGRYSTARQSFADALLLCRNTGHDNETAGCLAGLGLVAYFQADHAQAREKCIKSVRLYRVYKNQRGLLAALSNLAMCLVEEGAYDEAAAAIQDAREIWREFDDAVAHGQLLTLQARLARLRGHWDEANRYAREAIAVLTAINEQRIVAIALREAGFAVLQGGDDDAAWPLALDSLARLIGAAIEPEYAATLELLAILLVRKNDLAAATRLAAAAATWRKRLGTPIPPSHDRLYQASLARLRSELDSGTLAEHWSQGRALSIHEIAKACRPHGG